MDHLTPPPLRPQCCMICTVWHAEPELKKHTLRRSGANRSITLTSTGMGGSLTPPHALSPWGWARRALLVVHHSVQSCLPVMPTVCCAVSNDAQPLALIHRQHVCGQKARQAPGPLGKLCSLQQDCWDTGWLGILPVGCLAWRWAATRPLVTRGPWHCQGRRQIP